MPYLRLTWADKDWRLYRVLDAKPLLQSPAQLTSTGTNGLTFRVSTPLKVFVRLRFSPVLALQHDGLDMRGAVTENGDGIDLTLPAPGTYRLYARGARPRV